MDEIGRHCVGARRPQSYRAEVARLGSRLEHHAVHRRHADEHRRPPRLDGVEHVVGPELREQVDGDAEGAGHHQQAEAGDVRDGHRAHQLVAPQAGREQRGRPRRSEQGTMAQLGALGLAGRARRVEDGGDVLRLCGIGLLERLLVLDLRRGAHDQRRARVVDDVLDLVLAHLRVHRHRHRAGTRDAEAQQEELVAVRRGHHDAIARERLGGDAGSHAGDNVRALGEREVQPVTGLLHQSAVAAQPAEPFEQRAEGEVVPARQSGALAE